LFIQKQLLYLYPQIVTTMNIFDKWALKRADQIKQREADEHKKRQERFESYVNHRKAIRKKIEKNIQLLIEDYEKTPTHVNVGDRVILNYFSIKYDGRNGWDGGVSSLLNHIPKEEMTQPVTVIITKIYVDTSYSNELIDRYFENHSDEWLFNTVKINHAWSSYRGWLKHRNPDLPIKVGLYKTAEFKYEGSFQPRWGLNVKSFHREGTSEFDKTYELWAKEIEINLKRNELNIKLKELNDQMKFIDEEYRNIKVIEQ